MAQFSSACLIASLALAGAASAQEPPASDDPYLWLEDVGGEKALDWVGAPNAKADARGKIVAALNGLAWKPKTLCVRINDVETQWCHDDVIITW